MYIFIYVPIGGVQGGRRAVNRILENAVRDLHTSKKHAAGSRGGRQSSLAVGLRTGSLMHLRQAAARGARIVWLRRCGTLAGWPHSPEKLDKLTN